MSNSLDPDHAQCFVGPDLGPNGLQRLSAEMTLAGKELNIKVPPENLQQDILQILFFH